MQIRNMALAGIAAMLGACSGPQYWVDSAPTMTVPTAGMQTLGPRSVAPDQVVLSAPVGFAAAAILDTDSTVSILGRDHAFARADTLPMARLSGKAVRALPANAAVFCGRPSTHLAKALVSASTLGLSSIVNRTANVSRVCFVDADRDLSAEQALLVGVKSDADAVPVPIAPLAYRVAAAQPMSGESQMRIFYRGKTGMIGGHVSFDVNVIEQGVPLVFENVRRSVDIDDLPATVQIMGASFTVQSYDPATGAAVIDVQKPIPAAGYGITTTTTTQYIPIYVPR